MQCTGEADVEFDDGAGNKLESSTAANNTKLLKLDREPDRKHTHSLLVEIHF